MLRNEIIKLSVNLFSFKTLTKWYLWSFEKSKSGPYFEKSF